MQKLEQFKSLLMIHHKEKTVRNSFNLEQVLAITQRLALVEERDNIVTDLVSAFWTEEVVSIGISNCKVSI